MKNLALVTLTTLALCGCTKNDSSGSGGGTGTPTGFEGVWAPASSEEVSDYQDHMATMDEYYMFLEVNANKEVAVISAGASAQSEESGSQEKVFRYGKLKPTLTDVAAMEPSAEMIEQARRDGVKEEEIQKYLAHPCRLKQKGANELELLCTAEDGKEKPSLFRRSSGAVLEGHRAELKAGVRAKETLLPGIKVAIAGKKFRMFGRQSVLMQEGKEVYKNDAKPEELPEEQGADRSLFVNAKTIEFATDLRTARVNGNHTVEVATTALKDHSGLRLNLLLKTSETSRTYIASGKLQLTAGGGFSLLQDSSSGKTRSTQKTVYELFR